MMRGVFVFGVLPPLLSGLFESIHTIVYIIVRYLISYISNIPCTVIILTWPDYSVGVS